MARQKKHSSRSREKFADSLFTLSNGLIIGLMATLLLAPLGAVFRALVTPGDEASSLFEAVKDIPSFEALVFVVLYLLIVWLAVSSREHAMSIYTELHPDADGSDRRA
ncbi:hypothetical protein [Marilutibacter alkalisoli]|uniref:Uncharacterized protein n=1 Tax=Marilutibacter alkalisoli TaxID=2591633 RepID=A0A514BTQ4_9GAMM|nr:hypothetical protein [Lysobacter alkalisoli]QDH70788.1 hypothetical protein FKV23_12385 [Lysobacter alkalisoli]